MSQGEDQRTVVVGIDGGNFELLKRWIEAGKLPNFEHILDNGVTGKLESVLPPVTSPNWKAYTTGKNPGKIGIFWWENVDVENHSIYYPGKRKHHNTEFWELIGSAMPTGILGVPTTYPPKSSDAIVVAGAPDGENKEFTNPPELESELYQEFNYRVTKHNHLKRESEDAIEEIHDLIDLRFRAAKHLLNTRDLSFLQVTTFYINSLQHFLWDDEATLKGWKIVDDHLEELLEVADDIILMSDHGSNEISTVFHMNTWLEQEGYLQVRTDASSLLHRCGITTDRLATATELLEIRKLAERLVPEGVFHRIPNKHGSVSHEAKADRINWEESLAIASGQGPVYVLSEDDSVVNELMNKLEEVTDPNGAQIAESVHRGAEIYSGGFEDEAPDIVINQAPGVHVSGDIGRPDVFSPPHQDGWRGENQRQGLFAAMGTSFRKGELEDVSILDLAPTMLHLHGLAVPEDMDGRVLTEAFADKSAPAERPVQHTASHSREREIRRIRSIARQLEF